MARARGPRLRLIHIDECPVGMLSLPKLEVREPSVARARRTPRCT
jgi:hypothetical protein